MKKFLIGCGIVTLLTIIVIVGFVTFFFVKANQVADSWNQAGIDVQALHDDFPYTTPKEGTDLDGERLDQYIVTRTQLINRAMEMNLIQEMVVAAEQNRQPNVGAGDMMALFTETPKLMSDYANILRKVEMSPREYGYLSREVLHAVEEAASNGDPEFQAAWNKLQNTAKEVEKAMAQNQNPNQEFDVDLQGELDAAAMGVTSENNVNLVSQYKPELTERPELLIVELMLSQMLEQATTNINSNRNAGYSTTTSVNSPQGE